MKNSERSPLQISPFTLISVISGALLLVALVLITGFSDIPAWIASLAFLIVYVLAVSVAYLTVGNAGNNSDSEKERASLGMLMTETLAQINDPAVITTDEGKIVWTNTAMCTACGETGSPVGLMLDSFLPISSADIFTADPKTGRRVVMHGRPYTTRSYLMEAPERRFFLTLLDDRSELESAIMRADDELSVVAYATLDNLEELSQYARVSYRDAANKVEDILKNWVAGMSGLIREYDRDKFIMIIPQKQLGTAITNKFEILDTIRSVKTGDIGMPLTVSMGISTSGASLAERGREAGAALETALQRGGDQAVMKTAAGQEFFGGRTKSSRGRTLVTSRVVADRLVQLMENAGNILIMGHKSPDFDCIGASVGIARLATQHSDSVKIIADKKDKNFRICTDRLLDEPGMRELFIDASAGMDMLRSDTLLIIADVNNIAICESPEIASNVFHTVIIDHHRKANEFVNEPSLVYIEPSASSTCELVAEMLEMSNIHAAADGKPGLLRREADIMLAGIMLDTQDFTRSTTSRTFAAALYLRECGASSEIARTFFYQDISSYITEAKLGSGVYIYRRRIAIAVGPGNASDTGYSPELKATNRVIASKTAEKLLTVRGVDAAFVLIEADNEVMVSARSNGSINVQLITEKLGGGGHFDAAGAQVKNENMRSLLVTLQKCIDEYLG